MRLSPEIQNYVDSNLITLEQAMGLNFIQRLSLESEAIRGLIDNRTLSFEQAMGLDFIQRVSLESEAIRGLIDNRTLTLEQAMGLSSAERVNLASEAIRGLIENRTLTLEQAMGLTPAQKRNLESEEIRGLIEDRTLTLEQAIQLTRDGYLALHDQETRQRFIAGDLAIEEIMGDPVQHHARGAAVGVPNINGAQSIHTASVHQAASESATRLAERYRLVIDGAGLESIISRVRSDVSSLSDDSQKNKAAKQCVLRITESRHTFTDPGSQITTRQLLALTFLAISDDGSRVGRFEDARAQLVEGLYEIQRGYNLSDTGADQEGGQDRSICSAGVFNKLIEKLQGAHPDCQIRFITRETASLKLPIVVREEAMRYLKSLANPNTTEDLRAFTRLISQVKEDGIEVIWDQIKDNVANRMFDEFGSLYRDRADHSFAGLIEAGQYAKLPDLSIFQGQVQNSKGYHQYCSRMLRGSGMFSSPEKSADSPSEPQQDNPGAQQRI